MSSVKTVISVKTMYFINGREKHVTLYREMHHNCEGFSDDNMVDLLNDVRRENQHIEARNIWVESTILRTLE